MKKALRPILRYHGGKWILAPWIIQHFPAHRRYVEPFGGAASVLLRKPRAYAEIYNELDGEITNLFAQVRDNRPELERLIRATPFSRAEYDASFEPTDDPAEQARRTVVRSLMGFGSNAINRSVKSGFRSNSDRSGTTPAHDWMNYPNKLTSIEERLSGVVIENGDALKVMQRYDRGDCLHYVDPPYVHATRSRHAANNGYTHELSDEQHREIAEVLHGLEGFVVLSGYPSDLYGELYRDWLRIDREALADGARKRIESLWLSPRTSDAIGGGLFKQPTTHIQS